MYAAVDVTHARRRLIVFFQHCAEADVPEVTRLARTIDRWSTEVLAYHSCGRASNGRVENVHMLTEKTRGNAHGFVTHPNSDDASSDDSASNGLPFPPAESEAVNHAQSRRARVCAAGSV